mmetsp:Transcript_5155/g.14768  ORF Transcript_5155/g.14768 Transcript_5155/m.14768 type:complete len:229 (-) Transcript_5155:66-752(-)
MSSVVKMLVHRFWRWADEDPQHLRSERHRYCLIPLRILSRDWTSWPLFSSITLMSSSASTRPLLELVESLDESGLLIESLQSARSNKNPSFSSIATNSAFAWIFSMDCLPLARAMMLCIGEWGSSKLPSHDGRPPAPSASPARPAPVSDIFLGTNASSSSACSVAAAVPNGSTAAATSERNWCTLALVDIDDAFSSPAPMRITSSIVTGGRLTANCPVSILKNTAFTI